MEKALLFLRVAGRLGTRTLGHLHGGAFLEHWQTLDSIRRSIAFRRFQKLDGLIVLSDRWKKSVAEVVGLDAVRLHTVHNPIAAEFEKEALAMAIARTSCFVLAMGIMERDKGVLDLIEAVKIVRKKRPVKLRLAGPERQTGIAEEVRRRIHTHAMENAVEIIGPVWGAHKHSLFRESAVLVLPSYVENFPLVLLEAAAAGLAIITTPVGATPEFFKDGVSAIFVKPGNVDQLAAAIIRLLEDPEERVRLGTAARDLFVTGLARPNIMEALDRIYQQILREPCGSYQTIQLRARTLD
jgi:glycosyltransferase involved in cell wall biosynthesis